MPMSRARLVWLDFCAHASRLSLISAANGSALIKFKPDIQAAASGSIRAPSYLSRPDKPAQAGEDESAQEVDARGQKRPRRGADWIGQSRARASFRFRFSNSFTFETDWNLLLDGRCRPFVCRFIGADRCRPLKLADPIRSELSQSRAKALVLDMSNRAQQGRRGCLAEWLRRMALDAGC